MNKNIIKYLFDFMNTFFIVLAWMFCAAYSGKLGWVVLTSGIIYVIYYRRTFELKEKEKQ